VTRAPAVRQPFSTSAPQAEPPSDHRRGRRFIALAAGTALGIAAIVVLVHVRDSSGALRLSPEQPATATDIGYGPANNSPKIVQDPTNRRFAVIANRLDAPDFGCSMEVSGDGGATWRPSPGGPALPEAAEKCYAPEVAFDGRGRLYLLFVGLAGAGNHPIGAYLTSSADYGRTFAPPQQVLGPENFAVRMAIDPTIGKHGRIHVVWLHAGSDTTLGGFSPGDNPILASYSDDGGAHFSAPVRVSDPERRRVVAPALALGPRHEVDVAYYDLRDDARDYQGLEGPRWDGTWSVVDAVSLDGGRSFGRGTVGDGDVVPSERVMLIYTMPPPALVVAAPQRACLAWTDARYGDPDVLLRCSSAAGRAWTGVERLNDDRRGNGARQYLAQLSVSPGGRIDAVFLDRRSDPENARNEVWATSSSDGGRTFSANVRLSGAPSDARIGQQYAGVSAEGQVEFGSRLGLLSLRSGFIAAWPDTRNSRFSSVEQDIFVRKAVRGPAASGRAWASFVVLGLLSCGLLLRPHRLPARRRAAR
jgi:hypothetical protein